MNLFYKYQISMPMMTISSDKLPPEVLSYLSEQISKIYQEEEGVIIDTVVLSENKCVYNFRPSKEKALKSDVWNSYNMIQYNQDKAILTNNYSKYDQIALLINYAYHYYENELYKVIGRFEIIGVENEGFVSNSFYLGYALKNGFEIKYCDFVFGTGSFR
jgi:hypothetical protein